MRRHKTLCHWLFPGPWRGNRRSASAATTNAKFLLPYGPISAQAWLRFWHRQGDMPDREGVMQRTTWLDDGLAMIRIAAE
jgi:hypothetical protein